MRAWSGAVAAVIAATIGTMVPACGGTKGGVEAGGNGQPTQPEEAFYEQLQQLMCSETAACCGSAGYPAPSCSGTDAHGDWSYYRDYADPSAGTLGEQFDAGAAASCLAAFQQQASATPGLCGALLDGTSLWPALWQLCPDLYAGGSYHQTALGAACSFASDTVDVGSSRCAPTGDGYPVCATWTQTSAAGSSDWNGCVDIVPAGQLGDVCGNDVGSYYYPLPAVPTTLRASATCADGLYCGAAGVCTAPLAFGATCGDADRCADGTYCDAWSSTCARLPATGSACTPQDARCGGGDWCDQGVCAAPLGRGADCTAGPCASGLACDTTRTCQPPPAVVDLGVPCDGLRTVCAPGGFCDPAAGVCVALRAEGAQCIGGGQCASNGCVQGVCTAPPAPVIPQACVSPT